MKGGEKIVVTMSKREAKYCNIKLVLIFLVVYGHVIESGINDDHLIQNIYKWIYLVHMPMFVFISGYFINSLSRCQQMLLKYIKLYVVMQGSMVLISYINGKYHIIRLNTIHTINHLHFFIPYWHLWYLLSFIEWLIIAMLWFKLENVAKKKNIEIKSGHKAICIMMCVLFGCLIGKSGIIGRAWSLSRTIVYLPYFLTGLFLKKDMNWKKYRITALIFVIPTVMLCAKWIEIVPYQFLWMNASYNKTGIVFGSIHRLLCYLAGGLSGFHMLALMPEKKGKLSVIGTDTFPVYLIHPYIILVVQGVNHKPESGYKTGLCGEMTAAILSALAILYIILKFNQWNKKLCYIL